MQDSVANWLNDASKTGHSGSLTSARAGLAKPNPRQPGFCQRALRTLRKGQLRRNPYDHYLAELYTPTPAWLSLSQTARQQFFEAIGTGMANLAPPRVEPIALGGTDAATSMVRPPLLRHLARAGCRAIRPSSRG